MGEEVFANPLQPAEDEEPSTEVSLNDEDEDTFRTARTDLTLKDEPKANVTAEKEETYSSLADNRNVSGSCFLFPKTLSTYFAYKNLQTTDINHW